MIEILIGKIYSISENKVILNCAGVGYSLTISSLTQSSLNAVGEEQTLNCVMTVREDDISLFGFTEENEKQMFLFLNSVSGIGAKSAIKMLSMLKYDRIFSAIVNNDSTLLSQAPGVGAKTAKKIILELKDKLNKSEIALSMGQSINSAISNKSSSNKNSLEAIMALVKLGYSNNDATAKVNKIVRKLGDKLTTQTIITNVLKERS
jgi:Holliday junction DNA helicase RuvA